MVYTNYSFFTNKFPNLQSECNVPVWIACYKNTIPGTVPNVKFWQYTSKGSVPGIKGNVDMNYRIKEK